jgi:hypothetical protein
LIVISSDASPDAPVIPPSQNRHTASRSSIQAVLPFKSISATVGLDHSDEEMAARDLAEGMACEGVGTDSGSDGKAVRAPCYCCRTMGKVCTHGIPCSRCMEAEKPCVASVRNSAVVEGVTDPIARALAVRQHIKNSALEFQMRCSSPRKKLGF